MVRVKELRFTEEPLTPTRETIDWLAERISEAAFAMLTLLLAAMTELLVASVREPRVDGGGPGVGVGARECEGPLHLKA